ncbi:MAG: glutamate--tRNA ligase [Thaumarchaeota archaeon]|nr:MAG: glutamate--tRNA ligase [Nitrososphaerota archaeon]
MSMELEEIALKWALKNAVDHDGKAMVGPVIAKVIGEHPELRGDVGRVKEVVERVVEEVNSMRLEEQREKLMEIAPELLERRRVEEKRLPPLPNAEKGKVVTRLPPEPSGYMHIGHGMSGLINYLYARIYDGFIWLRFEDSDPMKVKPEYYESFRRGYRWLGIEWDDEKNNSDDIELFYKYAEKLIKLGKAYVCRCPIERIRRFRREMRECEHRSQGIDENLDLWNRMLGGEFGEGEAILRLKGDMGSKNTVMRDPALFRIIDHPHPLTGRRYRVWPLYDFAVSIEDHLCGVTHVLRTSEFALRDELQNYIRELLGMRNPIYVEYSRFEFKGTPVSKRKLRALIENGIASSWDDPRFPTIDGVRRRGILPEAIREFTVTQTGFSYAKREYDWSLLFAINRRLLDPRARRLFFTPNPVKLVVENSPKISADIPYHPDNKELGSRRVEADGEFYISGGDFEEMKVGDVLRLKYLMNLRIIEKTDEYVRAEFLSREPMKNIKIIQWVPANEAVRVRVLVPDIIYLNDEINPNSLKIVDGFGERAVDDVEVDEIVQFERFGFCRRDSGSELIFIKAHD